MPAASASGAGTAAMSGVTPSPSIFVPSAEVRIHVGIAIEPGATVPAALRAYGAEIIDWTKPADVGEFEEAIERAALRAHRGERIAATAGQNAGGCGRV